MKNRLREELEAMLELRTGDSFTADNVHTLVNGIFAADEGGFEFVEYDDNAFPYPQEIGRTADSITGLGPADEKMINTIFIMPNKGTDSTATLMIVVDEVDPSTDPKTYQYVYVGDIIDLPSDVLTESSIVNDLSTGGINKPLSAEQGRTLNSHVNYVTCESGAADQVKLISDDGFELSTHLRLLVLMTNTNTHATPKFNINNTGIKDVWYNGSVASDINTWSASEVLDVYYDGNKYVATTYGGAQFSTGERVSDVGIDENPTAGSDNLVKSGGVFSEFSLINQELKPLDDLLTPSQDNIIGELVVGYYNTLGQPINTDSGYKRSGYILVVPGETINVHLNVTSRIVSSVVFFDSVGNPITSSIIGTIASIDSGYEITVPENAYYLGVSTSEGSANNSSVLATRKVVNAYTKQQVDEITEEIQSDVNDVKEVTTEYESVDAPVEVTIRTVEGVNGFWVASNGTWRSDDERRSTEKIAVQAGETYLITTKIGGSTAIAYLAIWKGDVFNGIPEGFTGGSGDAVDKPYIVPEGVTHIAICSYNTTNPSLKKRTSILASKSYSKTESDNKYALKETVTGTSKIYGVNWSISDINDEGERCFSAIGLNATIGIGTTDGYSDFDNIYPWSEMKRCNVKYNANGAKIITFEGETGFTLDGSNGDVFVRIPKFKTNRYVEDGKMYIIIGEGYTHPAFIENGVELDEIFVAAFEASVANDALYSKAGVIPANNLTRAQFLTAAQARGNNYTLFDMRSIDAIWRLMAVEFGKRNSNRIFGWGYSDYLQPTDSSLKRATIAVQQSNTITIGKPSSNSERILWLEWLREGNNICICDGDQANIVAQRKITSVQCASVDDNIVITFDGEPIDITLTMFVGNAPCDTNYCETIESNYKLNWHTGRADRPVLSGIGHRPECINPCRYRWIENLVGNVWHNLPDVRFNTLQMYVCENMRQYNYDDSFTNYKPIGDILPEQNSNGNKSDVNTVANPNFWITALMNDVFSKGNGFAKSFDTVHDGTLTSTKGYGGYYYLDNATNISIVQGGGFDHLWRSNILTFRAWISSNNKWYLYGARLLFKNID